MCVTLHSAYDIKNGRKIDNYWARVHGLTSVTTILDATYKIKFLEYYFPLFYGDEKAKMEVAKVWNICNDLLDEYSLKFKISEYGA